MTSPPETCTLVNMVFAGLSSLLTLTHQPPTLTLRAMVALIALVVLMNLMTLVAQAALVPIWPLWSS